MHASLQALKDTAAQVQADQQREAISAAEAEWRKLVAVAQQRLGPLWDHVVNMASRPHWFPCAGPPWGGYHYGVEIALPGHRTIHASFDRPNWVENSQWAQTHFPGAPVSDVPGGLARWMVSEPPPRTMTYYQTLGAAMVAAEIVKAKGAC